MRRLPLFERPPQAAVAKVPALPHDAECSRCSARNDRTRTVCMKAEGAPGGLLFITESPSKIEDQVGRPLSDGVGKFVRGVIAQHWRGPVAIDNGVRCTTGREIDDDWIDACRGYTRSVIQQVRPTRIVAMGNAAVLSVLGQRPPLIYARRGYGWLFDELDDAIPVFVLPPASYALRNRFDRDRFESDLTWALNADVDEPEWDAATFLVENEADAVAAVEEAMGWEGGFTYDVETSGRMANSDFLIESLTIMPTFENLYQGFTWTREALRDADACYPLKLLLQSAIDSATQNGKYDDRSVLSFPPLQALVKQARYDSRLMRKLLEPEAAASLDVLGWLVGLGGHKGEAKAENDAIKKELNRLATPKGALTPSGKQRKIKPPAFHAEPGHLKQIAQGQDVEAFVFHYLDPQTLYRYNARDVLVTRRAVQMLKPKVEGDARVNRVWRELTLPASVAVRHMEHWGIPVDRDALDNFSAYCKTRIASAQQKIDTHKPGLNCNSPKQVAAYLYDELGLKCPKETKSGGRSTDGDALEALAGKHPIIGAITELRKYVKLDGTYAEGMIRHIQGDGRIHPSILIDGTGTGRYSCADPNLQNLPRSEDDGHNPDAAMARNCFVSEPGWLLLELDYSQIELRVMAILSGDPVMKADFDLGIDIHMNNATLSCEAAFKIKRAVWDKMTKEQRKPYRSKIKTATFAKPYGKKPRTLAKEWGVPVADAEAIDRAIWGRYKVFDKWSQDQIARVRKLGYVETWWDGKPAVRRPLHEIGSSEDGIRIHAENAAVNCLDAETEALTKRGWVRGFDLRKDDWLLTKNPKSGELEWARPKELKFWPSYSGEVIEFESRSFRAVSTPEHRWLVRDKTSGKDIEKTSETISKYGDHRIHRTGRYSRVDTDFVSSDFVELAGWYLTDGYFKATRRSDRPGKRGPKPSGARVGLCQSQRANPRKVAQIDALLSRLGITASRRVISRTQCVCWEFKDRYSEKLHELFPKRRLTFEFLTAISATQCERLMQTMIDGDGTRGSKTSFVSADREQAEAFQALVTLCGMHASIVRRDMRKYTPRSKLLQNTPKGTEHWQVTICRRDTAQVGPGQWHRRAAGSGGVWCPIVPNTFFVARRSGHVFITGNTPVQGTAAHFMSASIPRCVDLIFEKRWPAEAVLTVHDSLVFHVREDYLSRMAHAAREIMLSHNSNGVRIDVEAKYGTAYGSLQEFKFDAA